MWWFTNQATPTSSALTENYYSSEATNTTSTTTYTTTSPYGNPTDITEKTLIEDIGIMDLVEEDQGFTIDVN